MAKTQKNPKVVKFDFYAIELKDANAKKIEKASEAVAALAKLDGLSPKAVSRLIKEAKHLHVSAIYEQREVNGEKTKGTRLERAIAEKEKLEQRLAKLRALQAGSTSSVGALV